MRKITLVYVGILVIVAGLFFWGHRVETFNGQLYTVQSKLFDTKRDIRSWITPKECCLPTFHGSELNRIVQAYNYLEEHYQYTPDTATDWSDGKINLTDQSDFWQPPVLTQAIINKYHTFYGDCEDGTFWLQSVLEKSGVKNTYACIGTVSLTSGIYGHAFVVWKHLGKTYVLETTLGRKLTKLPILPSQYHISVMFNSKQVFIRTGENIQNVLENPPLPPSKIPELENLLNSDG